MYDMPLWYKSDEGVKPIAKSLAQCMEIEEDFLDIKPFRRVRVLVDIMKPLKRFQMIHAKGNNTVKINFKYKRLQHFCFLCGLMCHTEKHCSNVEDEDKEAGYGWGMDIIASPCKGFNKNKEEVKALKLKKRLFVPNRNRYLILYILRSRLHLFLMIASLEMEWLAWME